MRKTGWWSAGLLVLLASAAPAAVHADTPDAAAAPASAQDDARAQAREERRAQRRRAKAKRERPINLAVLGGYGVIVDDAVTDGINPFGVGFGVRGGYDYRGVYLGSRFLFFLGGGQSMPDGSERSADEWLLGLQAGYALRAGPLVVRPELGLGLAVSSSESAVQIPMDAEMVEPVDTSSNDLYLEAGLALELSLTDEVFVGLSAHYVVVTGKQGASNDDALAALPWLASCGLRF